MAAPNPNALHEVDLKLVILQNEVEKMALGASAAGLPQPPPFDGQRDFVEYLRTFNRVATAHGWAPERCCQILPLFLLGSARATYESLSQQDKATWKTLTDKLAEKLSKVHCKEAARFQLSNRKQKAGESVQEFASALKDLTTRAFPKSALPGEPTDAELAKFRSDTAKEFFRMGLSPELKEKILFLPVPETFEAAVQQAKEVHEMQQALKGEMLASIEADKIGKIQTEICAIREQLTQQKREGQQSGQQASKKPNYAKKPFQSNSRPNQPQNECFSCGRTGHLRKDCRVRNATYYKCQKQGHIANACRSRNQGQPSGNNSATNFYKNPNHIPIANNANNRANAVVTRSRSPSPIFPLLFIMATLISLTSCLAKPNSFQFCPNNPKNIVEIPPLKNCNISANAKFENRTMTLYLPKPRPKPFPIYRCWTLITKICTTHYSIFLSTSDPSNVTGDPPSGAKCQELAWVTKLQQNGENTFWTNFPFASEVGIWGEKCANTTNYFVEIGRAVSGKEKILTSWKVDLPFGTAGERFEKGSAFTYAWNNSDPSLWETHQLIGPVNGTIVNEKIFIIPSLQYAFHRSHHQSHEGTRGVPINTIRLENEAFIQTEESIRSRREASSDGRIKPGTRPPKLDNRKRIQPQLRSRPTKMEAQRKTSSQPSTIASSSIAQTSATSRSTTASSTTQTQSTFATQLSPSSISTSNRPPSAMSSRATQPPTTISSTSIRPPSSTTAVIEQYGNPAVKYKAKAKNDN